MKAIQEIASVQALNQGPCSPREAAGLTGGALGPPPLGGREPLRHGPPQFHPPRRGGVVASGRSMKAYGAKWEMIRAVQWSVVWLLDGPEVQK